MALKRLVVGDSDGFTKHLVMAFFQGHPMIDSAKYLFLWSPQLASKMNRYCEQMRRFGCQFTDKNISYVIDLNQNDLLSLANSQEIKF